MTYQFELTETLQRQIDVEADTQEEAFQILSGLYHNTDIVLDSQDYIDTTIVLMQKFSKPC
jgi:hypothetical protein